jgi:hypothetical protein
MVRCRTIVQHVRLCPGCPGWHYPYEIVPFSDDAPGHECLGGSLERSLLGARFIGLVIFRDLSGIAVLSPQVFGDAWGVCGDVVAAGRRRAGLIDCCLQQFERSLL